MDILPALGVFLFFKIYYCPVEVGISKVRIDLYRPSVVRDGLIKVALVIINSGSLVISVINVRVDLYCPAII